MSIPNNVITELNEIQAELAAAEPLASATGPTIVALQLNAGQLLSDTQTALTNAAGTLDTNNFQPLIDPAAIIETFQDVVENANDQNTLCNMVSFIGRSYKALLEI